MKEGSSGRLKRTIINLLITILVGFLYFYFQLPAINLHDPELYTFVFILGCYLLPAVNNHTGASQG